MSGVASGEKDYLTISSCQVDQGSGKVSVDGKSQFVAMINPANFDDSASICYNDDKSFGQAGHTLKFGAVGPKKVGFEIFLDGTGILNSSAFGSTPKEVKDQIADLKNLVSKYEGSKHTPNVVQIVWGTFLFYGCLDSMTVKNTLFRSSGAPLRAKVKLSFTEYKTPQEVNKEANKSSPDLTHIIEVVAGDTLPLLCDRIYKNSAYYLQVARINSLTNFRYLKPGMKLRFPPLK
jgi:hypothetical protein